MTLEKPTSPSSLTTAVLIPPTLSFASTVLLRKLIEDYLQAPVVLQSERFSAQSAHSSPGLPKFDSSSGNPTEESPRERASCSDASTRLALPDGENLVSSSDSGKETENETCSLRNNVEDRSAGEGQHLEECLRLSQSCDGDPIPYSLLRRIAMQFRHTGQSEKATWLHCQLKGSELLLPRPKPKEKSEELKARLAKLQDAVDRKEYAKMVADVAGVEEEDRDGSIFMGTTKDQLGFGLHVMAIMFTGYMFGFYMFRSQFPDQAMMHSMGGILGLIAGMLLEVVLFIIQASRFEEEVARRAARKAKEGARKRDLSATREKDGTVTGIVDGAGTSGSVKLGRRRVRGPMVEGEIRFRGKR
eukprot:TRINITY_DN11454_c0_g1_i2.p1 TRINITY_DN11454_c0_g1~~TRINITY_DN11454_c0_g1_i2.p1  ORF type:complete len:359 (-),score=58.87 TRINITY_DN11454_c0_g1_i2:1069-2145(-)